MSGGTPSKALAHYWQGDIPWFSPKDIKCFELSDSQDHISPAAIAASAAHCIPARTILVVGRSGVLAHTLPVAITNRESAFNQDIKALIPINDEWDTTFIALFLRSKEGYILRDGVKIGATVHSLKSGFIESLQIPVFPLEEQRRIAVTLKAQLAEVENARVGLEAQYDDVKTLKSAIFQQVFGEIAQTNRKRIGDIANTTSGTTPSRSNKAYWESAIHPWVKTGEVAFAPITQTEEAVSAQALKECSLSLLPVGAVLVAMYGQGKTRGQSAVLQVPATTNQACFAILPNEQLEPQYLQYWLQYSYPDLRALSDSRGGNQSNLNGAMLNDFEIPLIPLEQQKQIVKSIEQALAEVSCIEEGIHAQQAEVALLPARLLAQAFGENEVVGITRQLGL